MAHEESRGMTTSEETGSLIAIEGKKEREGVDGEKVLEGTSLVEGTEGGLENAISIFSGVRDSFLQEHQKREVWEVVSNAFIVWNSDHIKKTALQKGCG